MKRLLHRPISPLIPRQGAHRADGLWRSFVQNSPDVILEVDLSGMVRRANHSTAGFTRDQIENHLFNRLLPAEYVAVQEQAFSEARDTGSATRFEYGDAAGRWYTAFVSPIKQAGKVRGFIVSIRDVTQAKQEHEALRESEVKFRSIVESVPVGMHMYELLPDGRLIFTGANPAADTILKVDHRQFIGKSIEDAFPQLVKTQIPTAYRELAASGSGWKTDHIPYDGEGIKGMYEVCAFQTAPGRMATTFIDITERQQAEQHRVELAVEKERVDVMRTFISNISHDLKTPITVIQTSLFLIERYTDALKRQEKIELIRDQLNLLSRLIQDLLMISRLDYLPELKWDTVDVNDLARQVQEQFHALIEKKQLHMQLELTPNLPTVPADREALGRVLMNLVENAVNYTPETRSIRVRTEQHSGAILIAVTDEGIGIEPEDLPYIFNRYYRSQQAREVISTGSGLGLTIVQRVIEMHGGRVEVESTPGVGSTFRVFVPLA